MAETRKHNPRTSSIGERVREAIGGVPRVNPPEPDESLADGGDPFVTAPEPESDEAPLIRAAADPMGGYTLLAGEQPGLITLGADQLGRLAKVIRSEAAAGDEDDEDEFWDDEDTED
ncbi:hypothetical protein [Propionibacterium australiense]|uniref:Uncharacterized protein n=1 Tax=Propionibacterium australiense TaxID=119981 RepID=A0A383SA60_9ACTN|nr:hypothetical protein [Propionibacterium australiense]RLP06658.1 hypothetical protein D7U36_12450 [Propionibacterium australiense]RLP06703.1 hypothetical protein D9T14_11645 [Propionibacterium australiense]SYZ34304.1 Hypothetical protein PROPAUS_2309 [Propionibacterium australiense]VEH92159.1 Uncharacterised protein [Propionibacterium australiense]